MRLRSELDRLFDHFFGPWAAPAGSWPSFRGAWSPTVDIIDAGDEFTVRAEVPGLDPEDVRLSVTGNSLELSGEKKEEHEDHGKGYVRSERRYGSFVRRIPVPPGTDPDKISADYDRGVLTVHLPKSESRKPRQIPVSGPQAGAIPGETRPGPDSGS
jgi:HSP20 family protein